METTPEFASEEMGSLAFEIKHAVHFYRHFKEAEDSQFDFATLCACILKTAELLGNYQNSMELMTAVAHTVETTSSRILPQFFTDDTDDKLSSYGALVLLCIDCYENEDYPKKALKEIKAAAKAAKEQENETN